MSKRFFQRLLAVLFIVLVIFIRIPEVFEKVIVIVLALALFISTFAPSRKRE